MSVSETLRHKHRKETRKEYLLAALLTSAMLTVSVHICISEYISSSVDGVIGHRFEDPRIACVL